VSLTARVAARRASDEGFTLVEVMAAMVVFAIAASAVTGMFAAGLRASLITKLDTNAKNLTQQRFEVVRNLPFHIDQLSSGTNSPDLLDTYFRNATGSAGRGAQGYVPAGAARWTEDGDPASGAFYRYVENPVAGYPKFRQYVATQFLDDSGTAVTPPSTFNTQTYAADSAPTTAVGVSVTTIWTVKTMTRKLRSYTQLSAGRPSAPRAVLKSRLTALRLSGGLSGGVLATGDFASLSADGALSTTVSAATAARAATLELSSGGATVAGALTVANAPADETGPPDSRSPQTVSTGGLSGGFGSTSTANVFAGTSTGQPVVGSAASPVRADVLGAGAGSRVASFTLDSSAPSRLALGSTHAYVEDAACGGSCSNIGVSGYASGTSSGTTHGISTSATGFVRGTLVLMPTTFAPAGLVRVKLDTVTVSCAVSRTGSATPTASAGVSYSGSLSYYAPFAPGNVAGYVTVALASTQAASPLTAALLTSTQVGLDSSSAPLYLSDYFATWGSLTTSSAAATATIGSGNTTAAASFSGAIGITTVPLRPGDATSSLGAQLGAGSCDAEDYR
jgi:prepilin-type N-terminal cleavage/methylation domain-containing protein